MVSINFEIDNFGGKARAGKTLSMVLTTYAIFFNIQKFIYYTELRIKHKERVSNIEKDRLELFKKIRIISNLHLNKGVFGNYIYLTGDQLFDMYKKGDPIKYYLFALDDFFKTCDSRNFMKEKNKVYSYLFTEVSKGHNIFLYVSHFKGMVEKRLKDFTEKFIICDKGELKTCRYKGKKIQIFEKYPNYYDLDLNLPARANKMYIRNVVKQNILNPETLEFELKEIAVNYFKASKGFHLYNTEEVI